MQDKRINDFLGEKKGKLRQPVRIKLNSYGILFEEGNSRFQLF